MKEHREENLLTKEEQEALQSEINELRPQYQPPKVPETSQELFDFIQSNPVTRKRGNRNKPLDEEEKEPIDSSQALFEHILRNPITTSRAELHRKKKK